jgi:hypothetical protein
MSPDQLNDMRKRVLNNEPYTKEEFAQAMREMVGQRISEAQAPTPKAKAQKRTTIELDSLIS